MHGLILAGGDGSRLLASGIVVSKPLVEINGVPQVRRMVDACRRVGCATVTCAVRQDLVAEVEHALADATVRLVAVREPTSLHTLEAGLRAVPAGPVLCTLVDTVMPAHDWDTAHRSAVAALATHDAVVAVTPFVADESPLWVSATPAGRVTAFGVRGDRPLVTGGVYWFGEAARVAAATAVASGVMRLRGFLASLVEQQLAVGLVEVNAIVDVDTNEDLKTAQILLSGAVR